MSLPSESTATVVVKRPRGGLFAAVRSVPVWLRSLARGEAVAAAKSEAAPARPPVVPERASAEGEGLPRPPGLLDRPLLADHASLRAGLGERGALVGAGAGDALVAELPALAAGALLRWLRDEPSLGFDVLYDLTVVDLLPATPRFEVVYSLRSSISTATLRVRARVEVDPPEIESVASLWRSADWLEREAHDLFGVRFVGHPGLHPILLPPDFDGAPLRRDFEPAAVAGEGEAS